MRFVLLQTHQQVTEIAYIYIEPTLQETIINYAAYITVLYSVHAQKGSLTLKRQGCKSEATHLQQA